MEAISPEESLLLQCLATTSLLGELSNANFLTSDYYKQLTFANNDIKNVLTLSGLGNPATMQMMLYALLTVPRETFSRTAYSVLETYVERINPLISSLVETETLSTYDGEDSHEKIDYFRHIRNAVAHAKCNYFSENGRNYVVFSDNNGTCSKVCSIKIECYKVGTILMELQKLIMEYYNQNHYNSCK